MTAPAHELVLYARDRLLKAGRVEAIVADRVWYRAPDDQDFPNVAGFDTSGLRDDATCVTGEEITLTVHGWTRDGVDPLQDARALAFEIGRALHGFPLPLASNRLVTLDHRGDSVFYVIDGLTGHAVVSFVASVQAGA